MNLLAAAWDLVRPAWLAHPTPYQANTEVERQWCDRPGVDAERLGLSDEPAPWLKDESFSGVEKQASTVLVVPSAAGVWHVEQAERYRSVFQAEQVRCLRRARSRGGDRSRPVPSTTPRTVYSVACCERPRLESGGPAPGPATAASPARCQSGSVGA